MPGGAVGSVPGSCPVCCGSVSKRHFEGVRIGSLRPLEGCGAVNRQEMSRRSAIGSGRVGPSSMVIVKMSVLVLVLGQRDPCRSAGPGIRRPPRSPRSSAGGQSQQLYAAKVTESQIQTMARVGSLRPRFPGVFAVGYAPDAELTKETEALLPVRAGTLLSHQSAADAVDALPPRLAAALFDVTSRAHIAPGIAGVRSHRTTLSMPTPTSVPTAGCRPSPPPVRSSRSRPVDAA